MVKYYVSVAWKILYEIVVYPAQRRILAGLPDAYLKGPLCECREGSGKRAHIVRPVVPEA